MYTACLKDEETWFNWGLDGKTAKMIARHRCSDAGFYNADIQECGDWKFRALCHGATPHDWTTPYSDEGARARGSSDRNQEALKQCKKKGYATINPDSWRDKGEWAFSLECVNPTPKNGWFSPGCDGDGIRHYWTQVDIKGGDWDAGAKWLAEQYKVGQSYNFGRGNQEVTKVEWRKDATGAYVDIRTKDVSCNKPYFEPEQTITDSEGLRMKYRKCSNWKDDKVESCRDDTRTKPSNIVGWIPCAIGQNPSSILCSPLTTEFSCKWGQDCYAVTDYEWAKFEKADTDVCDNRPRLVSYDKCTKWANKDPKSCEKSTNKPTDIKGWIPCMIGVTPTAAAKLAGIGCSPIGKTVDTCKWGQDCFAITKDIPDFDKCPITMTQIMWRLVTGPSELYNDYILFYSKKYGDKAKTYGIVSLVCCILLILLCCISSCMSILKKR